MGQKPKRNKKRKLDASRMNLKVPVEVALDDLMTDLAKKGVEKFRHKEQKGERNARVFVMLWKQDGQEKYVAISSENNDEIKSLRKTFRLYEKTMNKWIKEGKFKPSEAVVQAAKEGSA